MITEQRGVEVDVSRGAQHWMLNDAKANPDDFIELYAENASDPQESTYTALTPTEARQLAAALTRLADEIDGKEATDGTR